MEELNFVEEGYQKFGGWLMFFAIAQGLGIIFVIFTYLNFSSQFSQLGSYVAIALGSIKNTLLLMTIVGIACSAALIYFVTQPNPKAIKTVKMILVGSLVAQFVFSMMLSGQFAEFGVSYPMTNTISGVVGLGIWLAYFSKSKRVQIFYKLDPRLAQEVPSELS
ncbi:hypothetical protein G7062_03785 [Erysipelothrix sp. HDW6C]|uniref:hypothetical protein n=1 Tax=Erysipelothrix sp. HDW6C TaxID=2714930 RepID=UPI00140E3558|nr:hypothetical protein [Erysipelothrix sp. HDW6C]QIK69466.1 hypothetical protein G7062_03785 [Erysipelothrix sp. HDW6C]